MSAPPPRAPREGVESAVMKKTIVRRSVCAAFFCALLVAVSPARAQSTIVAFGDSLTAGYGLPAAQSYPALLERALIERGHDVKIINAGVSGDTSADARNRARFTLKTKPQIVIVAFGGNDALRGLPPKAMRENLDFVLQAARDAGAAPVLAGMLAPVNLGESYGRDFAAVFADLAQKHAAVFYPFLLEGVALNPDLNQADGIHPNADGAREIARRILPFVERAL